MYTVVSAIEIVVQFKDVHGVALTMIWIIAAVQICMTLLAAIMMLIKGALGLCREHTKLCILYFCFAVHIKRILKKEALHDSRVSASVYISVLLHVSKFMNCQSFAAGAILN